MNGIVGTLLHTGYFPGREPHCPEPEQFNLLFRDLLFNIAPEDSCSCVIGASVETGVGPLSGEKDPASSLEDRTGGFISGNGSPQNPHTVFPLGTIASQ